MQKSLSIYNFQPNENIASIGASSRVWEIWFASQEDGLIIYTVEKGEITQESTHTKATIFTIKIPVNRNFK